MKKVLLSLALVLVFAGCQDTGDEDTSKGDIIVSSYSLEYIISSIVGEEVEVNNILPASADPHDYEPTQQEIISANDAELVFFVDDHYDHALSDIDGAIGVYEQLDNDLDNSHFWVSPMQMIAASEVIYDQLVETYPEYDEVFSDNYDKLITDLEELDSEYASIVEDSRLDTFIISHNSFAHLVDYGIETIPLANDDHSHEVSQKELTEVLTFIDENDVDAIANEKGVDCHGCHTLEDEVSVEVLELYSLEIVVEDVDYYEAQKVNIEVIKELLQ